MDDLLHQGITAYKAGKRDEARNIFIAVVKQSPDDELAWGWMYQVSVDDKERIYCLKQMLRINPKNEKAKQMLDTLAGQDFPFEPAQKNNVTPVAQTENTQKQSDTDLHTLDANHWYIEGKQLCDLEDYEEAIRCFENALQLEPQYAYAWREKALCEENLGLAIDAIRSYKQVLEFANYEPGLIRSALARLAKLERNQVLLVNHKEIIGSQNQKTDRKVTEHPTGTIYQPGDVIGQEFEVHRVLGRGGFGVVYLVYCRPTADMYALKTFHDEFLADAKIRDLFRKEANVLVELDRHPYLVQTFFVNEISGRLFIAMEYIAPNEQGINSLAGYLQNCPPELAQSLRWAIQVCFGMEYAYSKCIRTHRDLKPENIMISQDGTAKITDFGLAGILDLLPENSARLMGNSGLIGKTQIGVGIGTPTHMPPEQFENAASCDQRSDIYAFGVVLFQMASGGEPPFLARLPRDGSREEFMRFWLDMQQMHNEAPVPRLVSPIFPIIRRCLEKKPDKRYQSFAQLRSDLEPILKKLKGEVIRLPQLGELDLKEWVRKGISLTHLGRNEEAIHCFEQVLEVNPQDSIVWNNKGFSLVYLGRNEEAIHCFEQAMNINPQYAHAWSGKGICLAMMERHLDALDCFNQSLKFDPQDGGTWCNKGISLATQGRQEEAIVSFDRALTLNPLHRDSWLLKGISLGTLDRQAEALHCYDHALEIDPRHAISLYHKGNCLNRLGRYEESIHCSDQALEIDPCYITAFENKAASLGGLGHYEEAVRCCDKTLEFDPRNVMALINKGYCLDGLGHYEDALQCFDHALDLDSCNVLALVNKSSSLARLGRYEEAIRYCDKTLEIDLRHGLALYNKGVCLHSLNRFEEAIHYFDCALELDPQNLGALFNKSNSLDNLGRKREAVQSYRQFLALAPAQNTDFFEHACQRIRELEGE